MSKALARRGALLILVLLGALHAWRTADGGVGIDFYQFWSVGQAVREGLSENVYAPEAWPRLARLFHERAAQGGESRHRTAAEFRRDEIQTSNTPFLYAAFHVFESGSYEKDIGRFRALSLLVAAAAVVALGGLCGLGVEGVLVTLAFALWAFTPLHYDLAEGNVNALQLGCIALALLILRAGESGRLPAAGAVLGLGVAFKPNLLFVPLAAGVAWCMQRRWRDSALAAGGVLAGGAVAVGAGAIFFGGVRPWLDWVETLRHIQETFGSEVRWGSFGGGRLILDMTGMNLSPLLYLACFAVIGFAAWRGRGDDGARAGWREGDLLIVGVGPLIPLVAADLAWPHYLVQAIPLAIVLVARPARDGIGGPAGWVSVAGLAGICSSPVVDWIGPRSDYLYAVPLALGALLLLAGGCMEIARPTRSAP